MRWMTWRARTIAQMRWISWAAASASPACRLLARYRSLRHTAILLLLALLVGRGTSQQGLSMASFVLQWIESLSRRLFWKMPT